MPSQLADKEKIGTLSYITLATDVGMPSQDEGWHAQCCASCTSRAMHFVGHDENMDVDQLVVRCMGRGESMCAK